MKRHAYTCVKRCTCTYGNEYVYRRSRCRKFEIYFEFRQWMYRWAIYIVHIVKSCMYVLNCGRERHRCSTFFRQLRLIDFTQWRKPGVVTTRREIGKVGLGEEVLRDSLIQT